MCPLILAIWLEDDINSFLRITLYHIKIHFFQGNRLVPSKSVFVPGVDRSKPYSLELVLTVPASSSVKISLKFDKSILKWLEYPPDANHGFYLSPAVITFPCSTSEGKEEDDEGNNDKTKVK